VTPAPVMSMPTERAPELGLITVRRPAVPVKSVAVDTVELALNEYVPAPPLDAPVSCDTIVLPVAVAPPDTTMPE